VVDGFSPSADLLATVLQSMLYERKTGNLMSALDLPGPPMGHRRRGPGADHSANDEVGTKTGAGPRDNRVGITKIPSLLIVLRSCGPAC
jgi:hypothetical protein